MLQVLQIGRVGVFIADMMSFLPGVGLELIEDDDLLLLILLDFGLVLVLLTLLDLGLSLTVNPSNNDTIFGRTGTFPELELELCLLLLKAGGVSRDFGAEE